MGRRRVIDLFEGRNAADLDAWLEDRPQEWKAAVSVVDYDKMKDVPRYAGWQSIPADEWMGSHQTGRPCDSRGVAGSKADLRT